MFDKDKYMVVHECHTDYTTFLNPTTDEIHIFTRGDTLADADWAAITAKLDIDFPLWDY